MENNKIIANRGVKRRAEYDLSDVATLSIQNSKCAIGIQSIGNSTINCGDITIIQQLGAQNSTENLKDIEFQLSDPISTFRGRHKDPEDIKTAFEQSNYQQYNLVVICGYGGIGKSELARKFIQKYRTEFENVVWIYAEFETNITRNFSDLQKLLTDQGYPCYHLQDVYKYLNSEKSIFIFDNVEDMKNIRSYLPNQSNKSLFLITSQLKKWNPYKTIELNKLDLESAEAILKAVLQTYEIETTPDQIKSLARKCEPIPLVLQITAALICQQIIEFKDILQEYNIEDIINEFDTEIEIVEEEFPCFSSDPYSKSIFGAVSRSLDRIWTKKDGVSKMAADILEVAAYLSPDDIEDSLLKELLNCDINGFNKSLATLVHLCLFQIRLRNFGSKKIRQISLHRTVQDCIRYHHRKINNNKHFLCTLPVLLMNYHRKHHKIIFKCAEGYLELINSFYYKNKCRFLYEIICESSTLKILRFLLDKTDLIGIPDFLCIAAICNRQDIDIKKVLEDFSVNYDVHNEQGYNAIYFACIFEKDCYFRHPVYIFTIWNRLQALIKIGANINSKNSKGNTVLHNLCEFGLEYLNLDPLLFRFCTLLIKNGADTKICNNNNKLAIDIARKNGLILTEKILNLSLNNDVFHVVVKLTQFTFLNYLIDKKICQLNDQDKHGYTILHTLCELQKQNSVIEKEIFNCVVLYVFYRHANMKIRNSFGETAEDISRKSGRKKISNFLRTWTPSDYNIYDAHSKILNRFPYIHSKKTSDVNYQDEVGNTLLHIVCDLDESDDVLIKCALELMISVFGNTDIKNKEGLTTVDIARRKDRSLLADLLRINSYKVKYVLQVAAEYKNFDLLSYVWWKYCIATEWDLMYGFPGESGCYILEVLCSLKVDVTEDEIIRVINDLDLRQVAEYEEDVYNKAIDLAKQAGREKLAAWLENKPKEEST